MCWIISFLFVLISTSVHSGKTAGNVKMTFGRTERAVYKRHILDAYGRFLKKCYSEYGQFYPCSPFDLMNSG